MIKFFNIYNYFNLVKKMSNYLDEILTKGYKHLHNHLIAVQKSRTYLDQCQYIKLLSYSDMANIILEVRDVIMKKVIESLPTEKSNVLFILGGTGAGKSSTFCYLRGDKMIKDGSNYNSASDSTLIGYDNMRSETFLPTIGKVNDLYIVDFPGFNDTNGQIVCLGMEFAYKALITKYQPKILLIEAINNTEGRFSAITKLGILLSRLLVNKEDCLLGLAKYTKSVDYINLKHEEIEQRQTLKDSISMDEALIRGRIKLMIDLNIPNFKPELEKLEEKLEIMVQENEKKLQLPLDETETKIINRKNILETEHEFLNQTGLKLHRLIRLIDLNDEANRQLCFEMISNSNPVYVNPEHKLSVDDSCMLDEKFACLLKTIEATEDYIHKFNNIDELKNAITKSSLLDIIVSDSYPEIGKLMHLYEIDSAIVHKYDMKIIDRCLKKYKTDIIISMDIHLIERRLGKNQEYQKLFEEIYKIRDYILNLSELIPPSEKSSTDPTINNIFMLKHEVSWALLRNETKLLASIITDGLYKSDKLFVLPTWAIVHLNLPSDLPNNYIKLTISSNWQIDDINACYNDLCNIYKTISTKVDINNFIKNKN
jgi:hypothetical protein